MARKYVIRNSETTDTEEVVVVTQWNKEEQVLEFLIDEYYIFGLTNRGTLKLYCDADGCEKIKGIKDGGFIKVEKTG